MAPAAPKAPPGLSCPGKGSICRVVSDGAGGWVNSSDKVNVCHATNGLGSSNFGFNFISVNSDSIAVPGNNSGNPHGSHLKSNFWTTSYTVGDIVESFNYITNDDPTTVLFYAGKGLGTVADGGVSWQTIYGLSAPETGAAILANGCVPPTATPPKTCPSGTTDFNPPHLDCRPPMPTPSDSVNVCHSSGGSTFTKQTWTIAGTTAAGHGLDGSDIIPAFSYTTGYTWDAAGSDWVPTSANYVGQNLGTLTLTVNFGAPYGSVTVTTTGASLLAADCVLPAPNVPQPTPSPVNVCHYDGAAWSRDVVTDPTSLKSPLGVLGSHATHADDVIEAFSYYSTYTWDAVTHSWVGSGQVTFAGQNLTTVFGVGADQMTGAARLALSSCTYGSAPTISDVSAPVCHALGNGRYTPDTWTVHNGDVTAGHGAHGDDIIGEFDYVSGYTLVGGTWTATNEHFGGRNLGTITITDTVPGYGPVTRTFTGADLLKNGCAIADIPQLPTQVPTQVSICHAGVANGFDTYTRMDVTSDDVVMPGGHDFDANDVIPAFNYDGTPTYDAATNSWTPTLVPYAGKNVGTFTRTVTLADVGTISWTFDGAKMLASGDCGFTMPSSKPTVSPAPVSICHAFTVGGIDGYTPVATTSDDVIGITGHGPDVNDIMPAFSYTTGYTYDAGTDTWSPVVANFAGRNLGTFTRTLNLASGNTTVTLNGTTMLANGCTVPEVPTSAPLVPPSAESPAPTVIPAWSVDPIIMPTETDPTGAELIPTSAVLPAATTPTEANATLPFTGQQLGTFVLFALASLGMGLLLHAPRRRRRADAKD